MVKLASLLILKPCEDIYRYTDMAETVSRN